MALRDALEYAKQNPNSQYANELRRRLESGQLDQEAQAEGIDTSKVKPAVHVPPPAAPKPSPFQTATKVAHTIGKFTGGNKLGEMLGTSIAAGGRLLKGDTEGFNNILDSETVTPKALAGDLTKAVTTPLTLAMGGAPTILGKAAQFGGIGAAQGAGESMVNDNDWKQVAKDSFYSGLTGAAMGGTLGVIQKSVGSLVKKGPEALYNNALKVSQRLKNADKSPSKFLADKGTWGTLGSIQKAAMEGNEAESKAIANKIAARVSEGGDVVTNYHTIKQAAVAQLSKKLEGLYSNAQIAQFVDDVPVDKLRTSKEGLGLVELNQLRSKLGTLLGDTKWTQQNPTQVTKAVQAVYGALADTVKTTSGTAEEFARQSKWLTTMKVVKEAIGKADAKAGVGLYDFVAGGTGAGIGAMQGDSPVEKLKNAAIGGAGAIAAERLVNSPALKTGLAQLLKKADSLPVDSTGRVTKTAVLELLGKFVGDKEEPEEVSAEERAAPFTKEEMDQMVEMAMGFGPLGAAGALKSTLPKATQIAIKFLRKKPPYELLKDMEKFVDISRAGAKPEYKHFEADVIAQLEKYGMKLPKTRAKVADMLGEILDAARYGLKR